VKVTAVSSVAATACVAADTVGASFAAAMVRATVCEVVAVPSEADTTTVAAPLKLAVGVKVTTPVAALMVAVPPVTAPRL